MYLFRINGGKTKDYTIELKIDKLKINRDKHRIEVSNSKQQKVYIYILEGDFNNVRAPGTGVPYKVLDYTRINDVENSFRTAFNCIYKECNNGVKCSATDINCQFWVKVMYVLVKGFVHIKREHS